MAKDWNLVKRIVNILVTNAQHKNKIIKIIKKEKKTKKTTTKKTQKKKTKKTNKTKTGEIEKNKEEITA